MVWIDFIEKKTIFIREITRKLIVDLILDIRVCADQIAKSQIFSQNVLYFIEVQIFNFLKALYRAKIIQDDCTD